MKKILIPIIAMCLILTACNPRFSYGVDTPLPEVPGDLSNVDELSDISDLLVSSHRYPLYSDLKDCGKHLMYFDLLRDDEYLKIREGGSDYVLFYYTVSGYGKKIEEVSDIRSRIEGGTLTMDIDITVLLGRSNGCFPETSRCRCIAKVDGDFESFRIDDKVYSPYSGGILRIDGYPIGIISSDLELLVTPAQNISIDQVPNRPYFYLNVDGRWGIVNADNDVILRPEYMNLIFLDNDQIIGLTTDGEIRKFEPDGSLIRGTLHGYFKPGEGTYYGQYIFGNGFGEEGVFDEDLNVVIEPSYERVYAYDEQMPTAFWCVRKDGKFAIFDHEGVRKTDFVYDDAYEAATAYGKR